MSEKRGNTIKLIYDFNEARCCEIEYRPGKWIRTTPREFRSFDGNRRILNVDNPDNVFYEQYQGPLYVFGSNKKVTPTNISKIQFSEEGDTRGFGQRRKHDYF